MKIIVWVNREIFKMLNQYAVDIPTLPVNLRFSHLIQFLVECSAVLQECRAAERGRQAFGTHGISGNVFANPTASSSAPYPQESYPWISNVSEHTSPHATSERQTPDTALDPRFQTGPAGQNTILELSGRVQELQNEVNCLNDSKDFQDAESVRSGNSHVTNQPMLFPKHPIPEGLLKPSFVSPRRKEGLPDIWATPGKSGNVFANPHASSSAPYPRTASHVYSGEE